MYIYIYANIYRYTYIYIYTVYMYIIRFMACVCIEDYARVLRRERLIVDVVIFTFVIISIFQSQKIVKY